MRKKIRQELISNTEKKDLAAHKWPYGECPVHFSGHEDDGNNRINALIRVNSDSNEKLAYEEIIQKLTGTQNYELGAHIFDQGMSALKKNHDQSVLHNLVAQFLSESKPKNALEGLLCNQIFVLQELGMMSLRRMEKSEMIMSAEFNLKIASKLLHLQHNAIDKLLKYRTGGEQKVVVQHVNVENGGRAIVGNFESTGGGDNLKSEEPHG